MTARRTKRELKAMTSATAHVNVLWTVTPNLTKGAEFMHGRRTNTDDWFGTARRLQLMTVRAPASAPLSGGGRRAPSLVEMSKGVPLLRIERFGIEG